MAQVVLSWLAQRCHGQLQVACSRRKSGSDVRHRVQVRLFRFLCAFGASLVTANTSNGVFVLCHVPRVTVRSCWSITRNSDFFALPQRGPWCCSLFLHCCERMRILIYEAPQNKDPIRDGWSHRLNGIDDHVSSTIFGYTTNYRPPTRTSGRPLQTSCSAGSLHPYATVCHRVQVFADVKSHLGLSPRIDTRLSLRKLDADQGKATTSRVLVGPWPRQAGVTETCVTWLPYSPLGSTVLAPTPPQPPEQCLPVR